MYVRTAGSEDAPLLLWLHGGGTAGWMWEPQVKQFQQHYYCVVPDLPGHGRSRNEPFRMEQTAEQLLGILERYRNGKPVHVIGFSLGAQLAVQLVSLHPQGIATAMVNSALVRPLSQRAMLRWMMQMTYPLTNWRRFAVVQAKALGIPPSMLEPYVSESRAMRRETLLDVTEANMTFGIPERFSHAAVPMLVTVGARERRVMIRSAHDLASANPHCEGIVVPNVGHGMMFTAPEQFHVLVEQWLADRRIPREGRI